jgi:hypothetical protein
VARVHLILVKSGLLDSHVVKRGLIGSLVSLYQISVCFLYISCFPFVDSCENNVSSFLVVNLI